MRKIHTMRYNKQVPGHQIQLDVKFLTFTGKKGEKIRRIPPWMIRPASGRSRYTPAVLRPMPSIFVDYVISKIPFRILEIRTDCGREFQAKFHWHVEDKGIRHAYIKPASPQLNGKVGSHRSDQEKFYQLLTYKYDVDLQVKLEVGKLL